MRIRLTKSLCIGIASGLFSTAFFFAAEARSIHGHIEYGQIPSSISLSLNLVAPLFATSELRVRPLEAGGPAALSYPVQTSIAIRSALSNLSRGDYVVITGEYVDTNLDGIFDVLDVTGVESVGLQKLLGNWRNSNWDIFRFQDYNRLELYRPTTSLENSSKLHLRKLKVLHYTLAPETRGSFSVLMVERIDTSEIANYKSKPVFAGRIEITSTSGLVIDLFDPASGKTIESHSLISLEADQ